MTREEAINVIKGARQYLTAGNPIWDAEKVDEAIDMAIEALSAPQTDLISQADAMGAVQDHFNADGFKGYDDGQKMMDRITALPSAKAETKCVAQIKVDTEEVVRRIKEEYDITDGWIPCSERLPDVDVEVLTTTDWSDVLIAWLNKDGAWETEEHILANDEILAWMPLPKPYRKDGE